MTQIEPCVDLTNGMGLSACRLHFCPDEMGSQCVTKALEQCGF
jgi:hypothetical protein